MSDKKFIHLPLYDENGNELTQYLKVNADYFITGPARHRTEVVDFSEQVAEEMELIDRIVSGLSTPTQEQIAKVTEGFDYDLDHNHEALLPSDYKSNTWVGDILTGTKQSPWARKPFEREDPPTEPTWVRIPGYKDYEVNSDGVVRNFWTKRVLSFGTDPTHTVEMHGPDGSPMQVAIAEIMKVTFGE